MNLPSQLPPRWLSGSHQQRVKMSSFVDRSANIASHSSMIGPMAWCVNPVGWLSLQVHQIIGTLGCLFPTRPSPKGPVVQVWP